MAAVSDNEILVLSGDNSAQESDGLAFDPETKQVKQKIACTLTDLKVSLKFSSSKFISSDCSFLERLICSNASFCYCSQTGSVIQDKFKFFCEKNQRVVTSDGKVTALICDMNMNLRLVELSKYGGYKAR